MNFGLSQKGGSPLSHLSIKFIFLLLLFIGFPYALIKTSINYQNKASGIIGQEQAVVKIQTEKQEDIKVLTQVEANTLNKINEFIQGTWVSEYDGKYKLEINTQNKFNEYYEGVKEGFGVWRAYSAVPESVSLSDGPDFIYKVNENKDIDNQASNDSSADMSDKSSSTNSAQSPNYSAYSKTQFESGNPGEPKYYFKKEQYEPGHQKEVYIYQIQQLDTEKLILIFKGGTGKNLVFIKATSSNPL
ncbi:MAG: hypothetical protein QG568_236 [Patescibacteria group bacterium]|nr:hypothetical protein [Patescibacteria group bacterium]